MVLAPFRVGCWVLAHGIRVGAGGGVLHGWPAGGGEDSPCGLGAHTFLAGFVLSFFIYFFLLTISRNIISRACVAGGESVRNNSLMMQICVSVTHPVGACKLWRSHTEPLASCTVKKVYFSKSHFCA